MEGIYLIASKKAAPVMTRLFVIIHLLFAELRLNLQNFYSHEFYTFIQLRDIVSSSSKSAALVRSPAVVSTSWIASL